MGSTVDGVVGFSLHGMPGFDRRLTDKILAAFNHAYAAGDVDVARRLHAALALDEDHERRQLRTLDGAERRGTDAVDQAGLWVAYVEARNSYQTTCRSDGDGTDEAKAAFDAMKRAYRRWSTG
jgi:hypothetical protein